MLTPFIRRGWIIPVYWLILQGLQSNSLDFWYFFREIELLCVFLWEHSGFTCFYIEEFHLNLSGSNDIKNIQFVIGGIVILIASQARSSWTCSLP